MRLLERIQSGEYKPGTPLPTEPEIAEEFGMSRMTANKAILSLVQDGWLYRRKRAGTFVAENAGGTLARRPTLTIPWPEQTLEDDYFQGLYWSLNSHLVSAGISLRIVPMPDQDRVATLSGCDADPLILLGAPRTLHTDLLEIARMGTRILLLGTNLTGYGIMAIDSDNLLGAGIAVGHLAELGHRRFGFIGAWPDDTNTIDRERGYRTALQSHGYAYQPERSIVCQSGLFERDHRALEMVRAMLQAPDRPTAVFAAGSNIAMELMSLAADLGLGIPNDLSIVGYDDPPFASRLIPPLTTIRQPLSEMAAFAADLILHPRSRPCEDYTLFDPQLVVRGTTSPPSH